MFSTIDNFGCLLLTRTACPQASAPTIRKFSIDQHSFITRLTFLHTVDMESIRLDTPDESDSSSGYTTPDSLSLAWSPEGSKFPPDVRYNSAGDNHPSAPQSLPTTPQNLTSHLHRRKSQLRCIPRRREVSYRRHHHHRKADFQRRFHSMKILHRQSKTL